MKHLLILLIIFISSQITIAQDATCKVLIEAIKGTYEGGCIKGKAEGLGKSIGTDTYEGSFKAGYPEGQGKYTWKNGDYYVGNWKKGIKEGKGEFHTKLDKSDSALVGYWKKDVYRGIYEFPYIIYNSTSEIGRVQISKISEKDKTLTITVQNLLDGSGFGAASSKATTTMTGHQITRGWYISTSQATLNNKDITYFRGIAFPFRGTFNFGNSMIDIEFFEEGAWDVYVPINK